MSRFYSFYELLNFWTLNYELGDDLHKTRWQGANIKATHRPSACVHLDSPELLRVVVPLHRVRMVGCVCTRAKAFHFLCICWGARWWECMWQWESVWLIVRVYIIGVIVHYSLTVLPSEIPGSGCVTQTHTNRKNVHTHTLTHTLISRLNTIILHCCFVPSDVFKKCPGDRQRRRDVGFLKNTHTLSILYCKTTHLVTA